MSVDGTVVVAQASSASGSEAFRWAAEGMVALGDLGGGRFESLAHAVSADGRSLADEGIDPEGHAQAWVAVLPE